MPIPPPADGAYSSVPTFLPREENGKGPHPNMIATEIMNRQALVSDRNDRLFHYNGSYWEQISTSLLKSWAMQLDHHMTTSARRRNEAADFVQRSIYKTEIPWRNVGLRDVACANGVVDVASGEIRPHSQNNYLEAVIPWEFDPAAKSRLWLSTLQDFFGDDPEGAAKIAALQEFFGYIVLPHAKYKKALMLYGPSDSGKSLIAQIAQDLVGPKNYCTISTDDMADAMLRAPIVGKMVNLLTELPTEALIHDSGFKQLVSAEDPIHINPKHEKPFSYVPFCKHVIVCNTLPSINDQTSATTNRLLMIVFHRVFKGAEVDRMRRERLRAEMKGILAWAIEGAARLVANAGEFTTIGESASAIQRYRDEGNEIKVFIEDTGLTQEEGAVVSMEEFRSKLAGWQKGSKSLSVRRISNLMAALGMKIEARKVRGVSKRCLVGWYWPTPYPGDEG